MYLKLQAEVFRWATGEGWASGPPSVTKKFFGFRSRWRMCLPGMAATVLFIAADIFSRKSDDET